MEVFKKEVVLSKDKFKDDYKKFLEDNFSVIYTVKNFQSSNIQKLKDNLLKNVIKCIDEYLMSVVDFKKKVESKPTQNSRSKYEKLNWNNFLVVSIEQWLEVRREISKIFNNLKDSSMNSLENLLNLWDKMNEFLKKEVENSKNWPEEHTIQIKKKLNALSLVIRDEKNVKFIKCIQQNKEECVL